jgi:BlaI family transcriptional regulator, penicillinase repressor
MASKALRETSGETLSRRERQIMDVVWAKGEVGVSDVLDALSDPPHYNTVRALLRILEEKGHLTHKEDGGRYIYLPVASPQAVGGSALERVVQTFFGGSIERTVATLLQSRERNLTEGEIERLSALIAEAKGEKEEPKEKKQP